MRQRIGLPNALHQKPSALADGCLLLQVLLEHVQRAPAGAADAECRDGQGVGGRLALGNAGGDVEHRLGDLGQRQRVFAQDVVRCFVDILTSLKRR